MPLIPVLKGRQISYVLLMTEFIINEFNPHTNQMPTLHVYVFPKDFHKSVKLKS